MKMLQKTVAMALAVLLVGSTALTALAEATVEDTQAVTVFQETSTDEATRTVPDEDSLADETQDNPVVEQTAESGAETAAEPEAQTPGTSELAEAETEADPQTTAQEPPAVAPLETTQPEQSAEENDNAADLSNINIAIRIANENPIYIGDSVTLCAIIEGAEGIAYTLQWQYFDGIAWNNLDGANADTYTFTLTENNADYLWRIAITQA